MQHPTALVSPYQHSSSEKSSSSAAQVGVKEANESDNEIRKVPEMETQGEPSTSVPGQLDNPQASSGAGERKRGRNPADKEHNRLKRLLRNRVSAQQARERKKAYLSELEAKVKDLEHKNSELEEKASTLQNENRVLRQILKNTTMKRKGVEG